MGSMREGFEKYIRKAEDPARLPTFRTSLSKDRKMQHVSEAVQKVYLLMEVLPLPPHPQHQWTQKNNSTTHQTIKWKCEEKNKLVFSH